MKKLRCHDYLKQANPAKEQLYIYTGHLFAAHRQNLPKVIRLIKLSSSDSRFMDAYQEVEAIAKQTEENYSKR